MVSSRYSVGPSEIQKLIGKSFELPSEVQNRPLRFRVDSAAEGTPRGPKRGEEAYGMLADCDHPDGRIPSFLKIFKISAPGRMERNNFLMRLGLGFEHWMFQGFPYGSLEMDEIGGVTALGHISRQVRGPSGDVAPSLKQLIETGWSFDSERRRRLAGQLCCAVHVLEGLGLVHGDLALGNVLIGWDLETGGGEIAVLCDFDGFYHPSQPLLPLEYEGKPVRRCGSDGFFYPELLEQVAKQDPNAFVLTDRMALGALVCQFMVWESHMAERLGRYELLDNSDIESRSLSNLPSDVRARWPQGFDLLEESLRATSADQMISPRRWLQELGGLPIMPVSKTGRGRAAAFSPSRIARPHSSTASTSSPAAPPRPPLLVIRNRERVDWEPQYVRLFSSSGTLEGIDSELRSVSFERVGEAVRLAFRWPTITPLMLRQSRSEVPRLISANHAVLQIGGEVVSGSWEFEYTADYPFN